MKIIKIVALFLSCVFTLYAFAYSPLLLWKKSELKALMTKEIHERSINFRSTKLILNEDEFKSIYWIDKNEFMVNGVLYDLLNFKQKENGEYAFDVVSDTEEEDVMKELIDNSDSDNPENQHPHQILQFISQFYPIDESVNLYNSNANIKPCFNYINLYSFLDSKNTTPPPKLG